MVFPLRTLFSLWLHATHGQLCHTADDAVSSECVHALRRWCLVYCVLNPSFRVKTSHDTKQTQKQPAGKSTTISLTLW